MNAKRFMWNIYINKKSTLCSIIIDKLYIQAKIINYILSSIYIVYSTIEVKYDQWTSYYVDIKCQKYGFLRDTDYFVNMD